MLKPIRVAIAALMAIAGSVALAPQASAEVDVYSTPGTHKVNDREWRTTCEPYSVTERCRTEIKATVVSWDGTQYLQKTDWAFNNLTYLPSPRETWSGNPLATHNMDGFVSGGRNWRTECDTANTGRNGCRSYIEADVIATTPSGYQWQTQWVFNSMVRFAMPTPPPVLDTGLDIAPEDAPDASGWTKEEVEGLIFYTRSGTSGYALMTVAVIGDDDEAAENLRKTVTNQEDVGPAVCGTIASTSSEICLFSTPKYGHVVVTASSGSRDDLHEITLIIANELP